MSEVNRYTYDWRNQEIAYDEDGEYVYFEDYEKLKAQLERAESFLTKIQWLGHPERANFKQNEGLELLRCSNCCSAEQANEYFKEKESK